MTGDIGGENGRYLPFHGAPAALPKGPHNAGAGCRAQPA
jgi:hypothetical protein